MWLHFIFAAVFRFITIILLLAFVAQTFDQGIYYLDYAVERASYERSCVNKLLPQLKCHGKCQLMKKLQEQAKKEQQEAPELKQSAKAEWVAGHQLDLRVHTVALTVAKRFVPFTLGETRDIAALFFHPPAVTA